MEREKQRDGSPSMPLLGLMGEEINNEEMANVESSENVDVRGNERSTRRASRRVDSSDSDEYEDGEDPSSDDSSQTVEMEGQRRSSRNITKLSNYGEENSDGEGMPSLEDPSETSEMEDLIRSTRNVSVPREESGGETKYSLEVQKLFENARAQTAPVKEKNEMKCFQCEFRTRVVGTYIGHLKKPHKTTLKASGYILRCECGHEAQPFSHSQSCRFASFTVIRKGDGPIHELKTDDDAVSAKVAPSTPSTPVLKDDDGMKKVLSSGLQCIECQFRAVSVHTWISHLRHIHSTTPSLAGLQLRCVNCNEAWSVEHSKKCDSINLSVIRTRKGPIQRLSHKKKAMVVLGAENMPLRAQAAFSLWFNEKHSSLATSEKRTGEVVSAASAEWAMVEDKSKWENAAAENAEKKKREKMAHKQ